MCVATRTEEYCLPCEEETTELEATNGYNLYQLLIIAHNGTYKQARNHCSCCTVLHCAVLRNIYTIKFRAKLASFYW